MRPMVLVVLAIAAVLYGAPSPATGADTYTGERLAGHRAAASEADSAAAADGPTLTPVGIALGLGGGIVTLVLLAWYVVVPRRRRGVGSDTNGTRHDATTSQTAEDVATAALHRRAIRRAKVRLEEDPILASMGVGSAKRASKPGISRARRAARRSPPT